MDQKTQRTLISVLVASVIVVGVLAIAAVGGTAFFFYRHIHSSVTGQESAEQTFADARARFAGQAPLVELTREDEAVVHHPEGARHDVQALHALAYDERSGKLTHVDVPGWLLRMMWHGRLRIANVGAFDDEATAKLTLDDLERHGPGLVMDVRRHGGSQLLVWTE